MSELMQETTNVQSYTQGKIYYKRKYESLDQEITDVYTFGKIKGIEMAEKDIQINKILQIHSLHNRDFLDGIIDGYTAKTLSSCYDIFYKDKDLLMLCTSLNTDVNHLNSIRKYLKSTQSSTRASSQSSTQSLAQSSTQSLAQASTQSSTLSLPQTYTRGNIYYKRTYGTLDQKISGLYSIGKIKGIEMIEKDLQINERFTVETLYNKDFLDGIIDGYSAKIVFSLHLNKINEDDTDLVMLHTSLNTDVNYLNSIRKCLITLKDQTSSSPSSD